MNTALRYRNGRCCQAQAAVPLAAAPGAGRRHPHRDPPCRGATVRDRGVPRHHDGGRRGRGRRGPQDRLRRVRDQERPAAGGVGPAPEGRRGRGGRRGAGVVPRGHGRTRPRTPAAAERPQLGGGQAAHRRVSSESSATPRRSTPTWPRCGRSSSRTSTPTSAPSSRRSTARVACGRASASSAPPTCCGR